MYKKIYTNSPLSSTEMINKDQRENTKFRHQNFLQSSYLDPFQDYLSDDMNFMIALCINICWTLYLSFQLYPPIGIFLQTYFCVSTKSKR